MAKPARSCETQSNGHRGIEAQRFGFCRTRAVENALDAGGLQGRPRVRHTNSQMNDASRHTGVIHPTIRMSAPPLCGAASSASVPP